MKLEDIYVSLESLGLFGRLHCVVRDSISRSCGEPGTM